jgi:hypothetical protein
MFTKYRSQWPRGLRRGSGAVHLLGLWVPISSGNVCLSLVSALYCQVEVSTSCWSSVQERPTDCGWCPKTVIAKSHMGSYDPELGRSAKRKAYKIIRIFTSTIISLNTFFNQNSTQIYTTLLSVIFPCLNLVKINFYWLLQYFSA